MRQLAKEEEKKIAILTSYSLEMTYLELTETGLKKSISDATSIVRQYLKDNNLHNFDAQRQGVLGKVVIPAHILTENSIVSSKASLYRPETKNGDPRIWFYGLNNFVKPKEIISIIAYNGELFVFNLTRINLKKVLSDKSSALYELIINKYNSENNIANELLQKLRIIARRGPIKSLVEADTGIGRTLEYELGIKINSSKLPDYKGIELKSFRKGGVNRKNLFAQVPDWDISKFKSSKEILENFGYVREEVLRLYCTVSSLKFNSQGLILRVDEEDEKLFENSKNPKIGDFVAWKMQTLKSRLLEKHRETFWIEANSVFIKRKEHFEYQMVEHTKKPLVSNLPLLIQQAEITMDHLIKRCPNGDVKEKGPIFKIKPHSLNLLFPKSEKYVL